MKCKVKTGKSFGGCVRYVAAPNKSVFLGGTAPNSTAFLQRANQLVASRPDCKTPVLHFSLSQPAGERLTDAQWHQATNLFLEELDLTGHDYIFSRHVDTDHDHIHIVVSKIDPSGKIWNERNSARRAMAACTKIEQKLGLTITKTLAEFQQESGHRRNIVRDGATNEFRRTGKIKTNQQLAIQKRKAKEKENEQNRKAHPKPARNSGGLEASKASDRSKIQAVGSTNPSTTNRIKSHQNGAGEVIFRQNNQLVAKLNQERTAIEIFKIDTAAIDFAIAHAVKNEQIPLEIFGTPEFIEAATQRAAALKVATACFPNLESSNNQGLTKMEKKIETPLDRLAARLNRTEEAIKIGNIRKSETEWRTPRHLTEWLADELKRDRNKTRAELLAEAKKDERIKKEHFKQIEAEDHEQNDRSDKPTAPAHKM